MALLPVPITDPCKVLLTNDTLLSRLANELARELYEVPQVLAMYNIDADQYRDHIMENKTFMLFYAEARAIWSSSNNIQQRIAAKAALMTEQWLEEAEQLYHNPNNPMAPKVDLLKWLGRVAGVEAVHADRQAEMAGDAKTTVVINLGHAQTVIEKERTRVVETDFTEVLPTGVTITPQFTDPFAATNPANNIPAPLRQPDNKPEGENRSYAGKAPNPPIVQGN